MGFEKRCLDQLPTNVRNDRQVTSILQLLFCSADLATVECCPIVYSQTARGADAAALEAQFAPSQPTVCERRQL